MKTHLLIGLIFLMFACGGNQKRQEEQSVSRKSNIQTKDTVVNVLNLDDCNAWLDEAGATLRNGAFVKYVRGNGRIKIEWGNKHFKRMLSKDFECGTAPLHIPTFRWSTTKYIGLNFSCGSPCWGTIILPINPVDSVIERLYDLDVDLRKNLIVYIGGKESDRVIIENLITEERQEILPEIICESAFLGYCIDSMKFMKDRLYISWDKSAGQQEKEKKTRKFIKVKV